MLEYELRDSKKLPKDFLTKRRKKNAKGKECITLLPFTDEYFEELMDWL